jgi:acyl-CoA synthetase (AMP-forming)/AMP-acid ligase II
MNIVEPIFAQCRNKPSELAICAPGTGFNLISYARLQSSVDNICRRIVAAEIAPRSRIAVLVDDPILHAMIVIALTRLGVVTVSGSHRDIAWPFKLDGVIADRPYESLAGNTVVADVNWAVGANQPIEDKHIYSAAPDDLCRIVLTFDNQGRQKAIAMTHRMVATRLDRQKLFLGPRAAFCDRTHLDLPLASPLGFHVMLGTLWRGGALVLTWDPIKTLAALAAYKVQNMVAASQSLLKFTGAIETDPGYRSTLKAVFSVRGMPPESSERVRAQLCSNLTVGYVASDATMVAAMPVDLGAAMPGAAGYIMPGVIVEIVDDEDHPLPPGQNGNVRIRSDYGVKEYLDDASEAQRAFRNGWFYTGERGQVTNRNMLVLSRPAKSLQRRGGGVSPIERVEDILSKHTNVAQCGVVAVANELGTDQLCALVVPRSYLDVEALHGYCKAHLPSDLVPSRFVALSDLPRTTDGKLDRTKLPQLLKSKLN